MIITTVEKQKRLPVPGGVLTVQLSYPALAEGSSPAKEKKPRRKREKKKDAAPRSLAAFAGTDESPSPQKEGPKATGEEAPRGLQRAFSHIARIAEDFWREKTAEAPEKAAQGPASEQLAEGVCRRFLSLRIVMTGQREDAVSFLCRVEVRERTILDFRAVALTFSLPSGTVTLATRFADKALLKKAAEQFAALGETCSRSALLRDFYLEDERIVFFKNRFAPDRRRRREPLLTVAMAEHDEKQDEEI